MICTVTRRSLCSVRSRPRAPVPQHVARSVGKLASQRVLRAASQGTPDQLPDPVLPALKHYGAFAKAAYIMFDHTAHDADIKGRKMSDVVASDEPGLDVLAGYMGVSVISGFPGDVLLDPEPASTPGRAAKKVKAQPSFLGFIAERAGADGAPELVVAFRGSQVGADWKSNIVGGATEDLYGKDGGRVHRGFYNILCGAPEDCKDFDTPLQTIDKALAAYTTPPRIITTGHSLGGALAILAAATIAHERKEFQQPKEGYTLRRLQTYTFAAPRVAGQKLQDYFADQLQYKAVQMKNKQDAVPDLAPGALSEIPATVEKALRMIGAPKSAAGNKITAPPLAAGNMGAQSTTGWDQNSSEGSSKAPSELLDRLRAYHELAGLCPDQGTLQKLIWNWEDETAIGSSSRALPGAKDLGRTLRYTKDLLHEVHTQWSENPAAPFYVFDADETGKWGGRKHSLEVYLKHIKTCKKE